MSDAGVGLDRRMRGRLLAFLLGGLLIFGISGGYWLKVRGGFGPGLRPSFVAPSALQLWVGESVRLSGLQIGEVIELELAPNATIEVRLRLDPKYENWLRTDSKISIGKESLVGDNFVAISAGTPKGAAIENETRLAFVPGDSLDERVQRIAAETEQTLAAMQNFIATLNDPHADLRASLAELHSLLGELHGTRGKLDQDLIGVHGSLVRLDDSLTNLDQRLAHLEANGNATLLEYRQLATDARETTASLDQLIETTQPQLQQVLNNSVQATDHLDRAIQAARTHWPFKGEMTERLNSAPPDAKPVNTPTPENKQP